MKALAHFRLAAIALVASQACSTDLNRPRPADVTSRAPEAFKGLRSTPAFARAVALEVAATQRLLERYPGPAGPALEARLARPMTVIQLPNDSLGQALLNQIYRARAAKGAEYTRLTAPLEVGLVVRESG